MTQIAERPLQAGSEATLGAEPDRAGSCLEDPDLAVLARALLAGRGVAFEGDDAAAIKEAKDKQYLRVAQQSGGIALKDPLVGLDLFRAMYGRVYGQ